MAYSRIVGQNIELMMKRNDIQASMIAEQLGYSLTDVNRIMEGRLLIAGREMREIAGVLGVAVSELDVTRNEEEYRPLLHCLGDYSSTESNDKIMDFIDLYIDLEEAVNMQ